MRLFQKCEICGKTLCRLAPHQAGCSTTQLADVTARGLVATKTKKCLKCDDCYFRKNMLCALNLDAPCPTYRPAEHGLVPERQLSFVFRTERTRAAYAFPDANVRYGAVAAVASAQG
jgi:hypothetical protein